MVGYIVDLTIILHGLFLSTHDDVEACEVQEVINHHVQSGLQERIHHDIRRFITDKGPFEYRGVDLVIEKMIDLIKRFCVPPVGIERRTSIGAPACWQPPYPGDSTTCSLGLVALPSCSLASHIVATYIQYIVVLGTSVVVLIAHTEVSHLYS